MNVYFRADSSSTIGTGHVLRCLTLAKKLEHHGIKTTFICRDLKGNCADLITYPNSKCMLPASEGIDSRTEICLENGDVYDAELQLKDARECLSVIKREFNSNDIWIVVDHYALDAIWEDQLKREGYHIFVIDDLANRKHICDILLDQNHFHNYQQRYVGQILNRPKLLIGPRYALLRDEFLECRARNLNCQKRKTGNLKVLIYLGGTDINNTTSRILSCVSHLESTLAVEFGVLVGVANIHKKEIEQLAKNSTNIRVLYHSPKISNLMISYDCLVGACGTTTWERLCLGIPTAVIAIAQNQIEIAEHLGRIGLIYYLGYDRELTDQVITENLKLFFTDSQRRESCRYDGLSLVDGLGASRAVDEIMLTSSLA